MGNWGDFREFNNGLLLKMQENQLRTIYCDSFYIDSKPNLDIFDLGNNLAQEIVRKLASITG